MLIHLHFMSSNTKTFYLEFINAINNSLNIIPFDAVNFEIIFSLFSLIILEKRILANEIFYQMLIISLFHRNEYLTITLDTSLCMILWCYGAFFLLFLQFGFFHFLILFYFFLYLETTDEHTVLIRRKPPKARSCRQPSRPLRSLGL